MKREIEEAGLPSNSIAMWGGASYPECILHSIGRAVAENPNGMAVVDENTQLTYSQLVKWGGAVARLLVELDIGIEDRVAVTGMRSAGVVAAFLGTLALGATYVPLDPEYPTKRLLHMLADSKAKVLLYVGSEPDYVSAVPAVRIPDLADVLSNDGDFVDLAVLECRAELPIYVIYTSGTTGWPKGVAIQHSCLDNMATWQSSHSVRKDLRTCQFAPLNFDVWFQEVLGTLCGGGVLVIMPERLRQDPFELLDWLREYRIERLFLPNLALNMLSLAVSAERDLGELVLVEVNTAGEQMVCTQPIREMFNRMPGCRLNNHYGQSESAMVTAYTLDGASEFWPMLPPIGTPLPGCEVLIDPLDPADPSVGELLVAGLPMSLGYLDHEQSNAARFTTISKSPHGHTRAFRTGDLVRLEDGALQFVGRRDQDVKIRGVRVNLMEIDAWLIEQDEVVEAACVAIKLAESSYTLRAAIAVKDPSRPPELGLILTNLATVLPMASIPSSITIFDGLPRTPSGKIDRERVRSDLVTRSASKIGR